MKVLDFFIQNKWYLEDFITRSTYHSNAIEGNTLTYAETYAILYNDNSFKIDKKEPREIYEAINHKKALEYMIKVLKKESMLDERFIKKINEIINENIKFIKGYRKVQVFIRGSEYVPPSPEKVVNLMNYFIYNYNNSNESIFDKIARYHIEFEKIHPFEDGNGRTGRLLLNYELIKENVAPIVINKEKRVKYFELLKNEDIKGLSSFFREISNEEKERMEKFKK